MVPLREAVSQHAVRDARRLPRGWCWRFVVAALLVTAWLRHSRFGAWLQAVRDNEDAARAVGVNPFRVKLGAIGISAAFMGAAGAFYVQVFQYIDPGIAYGPATSVEALVAAIVGGMGTLWGPVLGAVVLHLLADVTRNLFGELPGINMVIYGAVLVADRDVPAARHRRHRACSVRAAARTAAKGGTVAEPLLVLQWRLALLRRPAGGAGREPGESRRQPQRADRPQRRGQDHAVRADVRASSSPTAARCASPAQDITGREPHRNARCGMTRTFQIVQPFAAQTVRENIAVGVHLHSASRRPALEQAERGGAARRPRAATGQAGLRPDGGRPQAAGTGARARHAAAPAAARRGAGRPQPAGDRRDDAGGARHRRAAASRC